MANLHPGELFLGYRLEELLGQGGFGAVWRVTQIETGRTFALKFLTSPAIDGEQLKLRADVELLAASASARSPHVVRVFDGDLAPQPYVVMEFVRGTDLATELRQRKRLRQAEVIRIGLAVASALEALQDMGIIHRDIKPANIMIDDQDVIKLMDFGIAKIVGGNSITSVGSPMTLSYAAPEVWDGKPTYASDLYALGVVLYECLVGAPPFRGGVAEIFKQHVSQEPDLNALPDSTAPSLRELIRRCLEKEQGDRPAGATECLTILQRANEELSRREEVSPRQLHEPRRFGPWLKGEPVEATAWSWHVKHEVTGAEAVVDVIFSDDLTLSETLRRAVTQNEGLTLLGGERLAGSDRLLRRPDEAWNPEPAERYEFWLARLPSPPEAPIERATLPALQVAASTLRALVGAAQEARLPLSLVGENLLFHSNGMPYVLRPGVPGPGSEDPEPVALQRLKELATAPAVREALDRSTDLNQAEAALARLAEPVTRQIADSPPEPTVLAEVETQIVTNTEATVLAPRSLGPAAAELTGTKIAAAFAPRAVAFLLDLLPSFFLGILVLVGVEGAGATVEDPATGETNTLGFVVFSVGWFFYFGICWALFAGSPAMRFMGLRVVSATTGDAVSPAASVVRTIAYALGVSAFGIGCLWALWDPKRQCLHDKAAGTIVAWSGSGATSFFGLRIWKHPTG